MKKLLVSLAILLALLAPGSAQSAATTPSTASVPDIVTKGFDAYNKSYRDAVDVWFQDSALGKDTATKVNFLTALSGFETGYGKYIGWELLKVVNLTPSTNIVYAVLKFENGPVWMAFMCYKPKDQWIVSSMNLNQNPQPILPAPMLAGQ